MNRKVNLYLVDVRNTKASDLDSFSFSKEEKESLDRIQIETSKVEKAVSFLLKRKLIGEYSYNEFGKPISKDKYFNVSHSKGLVGLAIADCQIGLDIELVRPYKDTLKERISNEEENRYIKNDQSFFEIWTSKESLVKCFGTGVKEDLKSIPALPINGTRKYKNKTYISKSFVEDELVVSITLENSDEFEVVKKKLTPKDL